MASVDSGVETGNESIDDPVEAKPDSARAESLALVPVGPVFSEEVLPTKRFLLDPLDGHGLSVQPDGQRALDIDIDPPSGLSFLNLQPSSLPLGFGLGYEVFPDEKKRRYSFLCPYVQDHHNGFKVGHLRRKALKESMQFYAPLSERKLRVAVSTNNIELVQHLLFTGVNPNCCDTQRRAPLHLAACRGYADIVRLLLENGANPNQRDFLGNTPLHLAACTNNVVVVTLLLKAGTDVSSSDYSGRSPLQLAQSKLRLLQRYFGSDVQVHIKNQVYQVVDMMLEFLHKRGQDTEAELLSAFSTRLTLSETKEQVETQVRDLLESLSGLSLDSSINENSNSSTSSGFSSISSISSISSAAGSAASAASSASSSSASTSTSATAASTSSSSNFFPREMK